MLVGNREFVVVEVHEDVVHGVELRVEIHICVEALGGTGKDKVKPVWLTLPVWLVNVFEIVVVHVQTLSENHLDLQDAFFLKSKRIIVK